jgi:predicted MFS family arabinose efflux permease
VKTGNASPTTLSHRTGFGALLALTMASSTFAFTAFSVLSGSLLDTFALRRWQLGALVTAAAGVGAFTSPVLGRLSDRIGGRGALELTLGLSALALAGIAVSPVYPLLIAAALASGLAQATANPATNKLIATHVAAGVRGTVTGIKQAGVQAGVFLGGSLLPLGAARIGWRPTVLIAAAVPAIGLLASRLLVPRDTRGDDGAPLDALTATRSPFLVRLALYGCLIGAGWSAVFTYLPDYGQHALGWSQRRPVCWCRRRVCAASQVASAGASSPSGDSAQPPRWRCWRRSDPPRSSLCCSPGTYLRCCGSARRHWERARGRGTPWACSRSSIACRRTPPVRRPAS